MDFYNITVHIYLETLVEWIFEFYIISFLLFRKTKVQDKFYLRYFLGLAIILLIAYPLAIAYSFIGDSTWGRCLIYFALFGLSLVHYFKCYKDNKLRILVYADLGYILQNITYKVFASLWSTLFIVNILPQEGVMWYVFKPVYYVFFALQVVVIYFFVVKRANNALANRPLTGLTVLISMIVMFVMVVLCSLNDVYINEIAKDVYKSPTETVYFLRLTGNLFSIVTSVCIIELLFNASKKNSLAEDVERLNQVIKQSERQYKISKETIKSINIKCHDMKHRINELLTDSNLSKDTMNDINESISIYDSLINTGNKTLDVIITEKSLICESNKIAFSRMVDGRKIEFVEKGDLCCLFGNILDNAIEACKKVQDPNKRFIDLSVKNVGNGIIAIECTNFYEGKIEFANGLPKTTKKNKENHGFGTQSILDLVTKYNGTLNLSTNEGAFILSAVIYDTRITD